MSAYWQFAGYPLFVAPEPIVEGTEEARFLRHRCRFIGSEYDLKDINRWRTWAAYKKWDHELHEYVRRARPRRSDPTGTSAKMSNGMGC